MMENSISYIDCRKGLAKMDDESIDKFYCDPPFDIDFTKKESMYNRKKKHVTKGYLEPTGNYYEFSKSWLEGVYRVLKKDGSGWICSGWSHLEDVLRAAREVGFTVVNHNIWKYQFGVYTKKKFVTSHYHMLFVVKNPKKWVFNKDCRFKDTRKHDGNENYRDREDVWEIKRTYSPGQDKNANTQPLELVDKALCYTTDKGETVLDCFMGEGTTAISCIKNGRNYIGFERNKRAKKNIDRRIKNANAGVFA